MRKILLIALLLSSTSAFAGSSTVGVTPGTGAVAGVTTDGSGNIYGNNVIVDGTAAANKMAVKAASTPAAQTDPAGVFRDADIGTPGDTACATDTSSCTLNALAQRVAQRLSSLITALGTPMQSTGGSVTANAGTNLNTSALALETGGNLATVAGAISAARMNANARVTGNAGATMDVAIGGATAATNALQAGGVYNSAAPTLSTGQGAALQLTSGGSLHATVDNTLAALANNADGVAPLSSNAGSPVIAYHYSFDGTNWNRQRASAGATAATVPTGASYTGGIGSTSDPTAVTNGQLVGLEATPNGKLVTQPFALTPNYADGGGSSTTAASPITILAASGSASLKEYLTGVQCSRSDAGTTAITIAVSEGTKTRTFALPNNGGGGGNNVQFTTPVVFAANTAVTATMSTNTTTVYCNGEGYYAP